MKRNSQLADFVNLVVITIQTFKVKDKRSEIGVIGCSIEIVARENYSLMNLLPPYVVQLTNLLLSIVNLVVEIILIKLVEDSIEVIGASMKSLVTIAKEISIAPMMSSIFVLEIRNSASYVLELAKVITPK